MCAREVFANMTQYRVNTRNCEAKRMDMEAPARGLIALGYDVSVLPDSTFPATHT
jgi:hypothetical protein